MKYQLLPNFGSVTSREEDSKLRVFAHERAVSALLYRS